MYQPHPEPRTPSPRRCRECRSKAIRKQKKRTSREHLIIDRDQRTVRAATARITIYISSVYIV
jgi:hypothetical protein